MWCGLGFAGGMISEVQELDTAKSNCIIYGKSDAGLEGLRCNSRSWQGLGRSRPFGAG